MLSQFLVTQVFVFMLIFCRMGAAIMIFPGFGESYVAPLMRLSMALAISLVLVPMLGSHLPAMPTSITGLFLLILQEVLVGIFIGTLVNMLTSALHTTGMILSYQAGLSAATLFDPTQATQGTAIGNFLGLTALTLMFALDLHHLMLQGVIESYGLFVPGHPPPMGDFANLMSSTLAKTFTMAIKLSAPLLAVGVLTSLAAGVLARLIPVIPIFFIIQAPQVLIGFFVIMISLSAILLWYIQFFEDSIKSIF